MRGRLYDAYHCTWHIVGASEVLACVNGIPVSYDYFWPHTYCYDDIFLLPGAAHC